MKKNINDISLTINILQGLAEEHEISNSENLMLAFKNAMNDLKNNPQRLHGIRVEKMFGYLARAMDKCSFIKQEDAGILYAMKDMIPPDYKLILKNGMEIYVEVKNCHKKLGASLRLDKSYISKLLNFPGVSLENLRIAVYWSSWGAWTLISIKHFEQQKEKYVIKMTDALVKNELGLLGETYYLGVAPLKLEFLMDLSKSTELDESGRAGFTIKNVRIYTGRGLVENNSIEGKVIFDLIVYGLNGAWHEENYVELQNNKIEKLIFEYTPIEGEKQTIMGCLSRTITNKYNLRTAPEGEIKRIQAEYDEGKYEFYLKLSQEKLKHLSILNMKSK